MVRVYTIDKKKRKNFFNLSLTIQLVILNVVVFIVLGILAWQKILPLDYYALNPLNILQGKYVWTFFTSMFMHAGIFHLFVNMLSLVFIGSLVEKLLGRKRYIWFYILSGLFAGLVFVASAFIFPDDINTFAVGASGALFALVGSLIILTPNLKVYLFFIPIPIKMKYAVPGLLIVLWLISILGDVPIGNLAHLGGLIAGLGYGLYLRKKFPRKVQAIQRHFN